MKIGGGETSFGPFSDPLTLVAGPQGGYHVWIALQTSGIAQYGTAVTMTAALPDGVMRAPPVAAVATLSPDPSGTCSASGLRLVLTEYGPDFCPMRGKTFAITVEAREADGRTTRATTSARVPEILPPARGNDVCGAR